MKLLIKFVNIVNKVINFFKIDYDNDYTPVPDYPWIEINSNLHWRVNTNHPEFIKNIIGFKCEEIKTKVDQGIPYDIIGDGIMVAKAEDVRKHAKKQFDVAAKIIPTVTEGKLKGGNGYTRNPPPKNYVKPKTPPPCPPPPPSREYKCTFFGLVETQESIDKTKKYKEGNNNE